MSILPMARALREVADELAANGTESSDEIAEAFYKLAENLLFTEIKEGIVEDEKRPF